MIAIFGWNKTLPGIPTIYIYIRRHDISPDLIYICLDPPVSNCKTGWPLGVRSNCVSVCTKELPDCFDRVLSSDQLNIKRVVVAVILHFLASRSRLVQKMQ